MASLSEQPLLFRIGAGHEFQRKNHAISNIDYTGSGYVLRGNTILDHRARGMLLKARNGRVDDNFFIGSSIATLVLQPKLLWGEANYAECMIIRNNTFSRCGYIQVDRGTEQAGVLTIHGAETSSTADRHHTLTLENNTFSDNDGVQLVLDGLRDTIVRKNSFFNAQKKVNNRGTGHGIDSGALIYISRARSLTLKGNRAWSLGATHT